MNEAVRHGVAALSLLGGAVLLLFLIALVSCNILTANSCGGFGRGSITLQLTEMNFTPQVHCYGR